MEMQTQIRGIRRQSFPALGASSSSVTTRAGVTQEGAHEREVADSTGDPVRASRARYVGMVVDTSTASWNQTPQKGNAAVDRGNEHVEEDDGLVQKKRKSDVGLTDRVAGAGIVMKKRDRFVGA